MPEPAFDPSPVLTLVGSLIAITDREVAVEVSDGTLRVIVGEGDPVTPSSDEDADLGDDVTCVGECDACHTVPGDGARFVAARDRDGDVGILDRMAGRFYFAEVPTEIAETLEFLNGSPGEVVEWGANRASVHASAFAPITELSLSDLDSYEDPAPGID